MVTYDVSSDVIGVVNWSYDSGSIPSGIESRTVSLTEIQGIASRPRDNTRKKFAFNLILSASTPASNYEDPAYVGCTAMSVRLSNLLHIYVIRQHPGSHSGARL